MSASPNILVINPGGSSTKIAVFKGEQQLFSENIRHEQEQIDRFDTVYEQSPWRLELVQKALKQHNIDISSLDGVVGRGGPVAPVPGGTFIVDDEMLEAINTGNVMVEHPSLLGAPLAHEVAQQAGCPSFIVDPVCIDEFVEESRFTGLPQIPRRALSHALSVKSASREAASKLNRKFEDCNFVVLHLGSGFTVAVQKKGRQIDSNDASASGPMAPTRAGTIPALDLIKLCFSGETTLEQLKEQLVTKGGWTAYFGTDDIREIYKDIDAGNKKARQVVDATLVQLAKETAAMFAVLNGEVDAIVLTGGVTKTTRFVEELKPRLKWLKTKIIVLPGDNEMLALAQGAARALKDKTQARSMAPFIK